ncbi:MAG: hypothetical protein KKE09_14200 [Bacteroidetes bacterium]|nr:hypothetical protein [Bacteroidota bacterium]
MKTKYKSKINLTINSKLIPKSKLFAEKHGKSVSQLVEELLTQALSKENTNFTEKWLGKLSLNDEDNLRAKNLKERYQL